MELIHVIPLNDTHDHQQSERCHCEPRIEDGVVIHNAFDGREGVEWMNSILENSQPFS